MLNLIKPLVFIDLETTGTSPASDKIIDIALLKALPGGNTESKTWRVNPGVPIPAETTKFHGITDADVQDAPLFAAVAPQILDFIGNADLAGYNSTRFDIPLLIEELMRAGFDFDLKNRHLIDAQHIFYMMEPRNLSAAYKFYCGKTLNQAHNALADITATYEVFCAQIEKYQHTEITDKQGKTHTPIQNNISLLAANTNDTKIIDLVGRIGMNEKGIEVFNFGKYKDKSVEEVFKKEPHYYHWMMQGDFTHYTKKIITQIMLRSKKK
ncbi:MAG: 3'-5' exonuclease [Bacteroidetes bacterium]|nr:3'-5' exonuclease [Bacteroidota bacterium]